MILSSTNVLATSSEAMVAVVSNSPTATITHQSADEPRRKKPYKELTLDEKVELIVLAENNPGMSQATMAERYQIAKSNVCRILQRKHEYLRAHESAGFSGSRKRKLRTDMGANSGCFNNSTTSSQTPPHPTLLQQHECGSSEMDGGSDSSDNSTTLITGNETLRSHMYKQHQISRMFMCRCCNWAFPDKTSLHMHMQAKEEGKNVNVPIIGKGGSGGPMPMGMAGGHGQPPMSLSHLSSLMSPPATVPTSMSNGMGGGSNNIFPQNPLSMVSQQPRPDDIMATLRERFMLNSMLAQAQPTLRLAAWLSQFPKVDASGVGRLGGSLNLRSEPNENEQGCNNNNHGGDAGSTGGEMAVKEESDGDINVEDLGDEVVDGQQCMDTNEHATNPSDDEGERNLVISDEMERTSDGVGTAPSDTSDEAKEASSENVHQQLNGQESLSTVLGRMPALRNAINSSSPLSSLLYKKRLDSALKRDNNTTKSNTESNQTNNQMPLSLGGVDMGGSCAPPTMTTSTASLLASMIGAAAAAASSGVEMPLAATTTHNATTNCSNNTSGSQSYSPTDSNSSGSPQHHHHHTHQPNGSTDQQQQQSQNAQQSNGDMCYQCSMMKGRLAIAQNRSRYLESRTASLQADVLRYGARASSAENNGRQFERECQMLREQNETLQKKLIECQEKTLMFMQGTGHSNPVIVSAFLNEILKTTFLG